MGANGAQAVRHHSWGNLNFSRTAPGITKWFWVTIEGYLSYFLPKFEDFVPTGLGSGALYIHAQTCTLYPVYDMRFLNSKCVHFVPILLRPNFTLLQSVIPSILLLKF